MSRPTHPTLPVSFIIDYDGISYRYIRTHITNIKYSFIPYCQIQLRRKVGRTCHKDGLLLVGVIEPSSGVGFSKTTGDSRPAPWVGSSKLVN